jgi:hypothetical protein
MWVRPAYHHGTWTGGDDRRLINLDHYRIVRVTEGAFGNQAGWAVEAITETMERGATASEMQGRTALLAAVPTEPMAAALFELVLRGLAAGSPLVDLHGAADAEA